MASINLPPLFDVVTTTADDLRKLLDKGSITSVRIVESYLSHIEAHNTSGAKCRAIISTGPRFQLISQAAMRDEERQRGKLRGPLHGIPILLKDNMATDASLGMPTTAGSYALWDSCPPGNSAVADKLIDCGLIILGKSNMTEFVGLKGASGWSAVGGMCEPAYIPTGYKIGDKPRGETTPAGSSTGSAVGVACGFAPIALGTETSGSIVSPSAVAALYALKLTPGSVPLTGIMEVTACFDTVGGMGKTPLDVALTSDALLGPAEGASLASVASSVDFGDVSVGFVDIEKWRLPAGTQEDDPEYLQEYQAAKGELRKNGVKVVDVYITPPEVYMIGDTNVDDVMDSIIRQQAKAGFERFLKALKFSKVRSLDEVIEFNQAHADVEFNKDYCPNQDGLVGILKASRPDEDAAESLEHCKRWAATEGIDKAISEHGVDVVVCCSDSYFAGVSVASRYPMAAVPLGYIRSSGRPYGLQAIAPAHQEAKLVAFMAVWERIFPTRRVPDLDACARARADW
ncbi:amidase [Hirsutella rhossiliensis]|uniref:Amidase domain-containing protein n=1 Tax=Hirsutella rhossiliensis TaxID=111463 RepID=A0A9P8SG80_9HYPO|nr:amidase domain-containing protein [Hirsutella rhossiliensis]KAH0961728.1 amidase domain-containing protein [Hirsutella rhossiliensis]